MKEVTAFNLKIHSTTMQHTLTVIENAVRGRAHPLQHIVVNSAKIVHAQKDTALLEAINNSDIVNIDGQAVVWALRFLGHKIPERVAGCDLFHALVALCAKKGYRPYFFGATNEVLETMLAHFKAKYPNLQIAGARNGYYSAAEEPGIAQEIANSRADMLFLGITSPKKELFIDTYHKQMAVPFTMGVGGSFDIASGKTKRAPKWMQDNGLEWFYRVLQEPRRMWKRYLTTNTLFIMLVLREKLRAVRA